MNLHPTARWIGLAALAAGLGGEARAQEPEPAVPAGTPGRTAIYSADRRFMVSGMTSAENMVLARKLSEQAGKVEEKTGMPLPMQRDQVLGVMVQSSSAPDTRVLKMPLVGGLALRMGLSRFATFFAAQYRAGLPILQVLKECQDVTGNARLALCVRRIREGVEAGERLAVMAAKEAVNRAFETPLSEGLLAERRLFHALFATADGSVKFGSRRGRKLVDIVPG